MAMSMATTSNAAMRKKTPFYVSIFLCHDTSMFTLKFGLKVVSSKALPTKARCNGCTAPNKKSITQRSRNHGKKIQESNDQHQFSRR